MVTPTFILSCVILILGIASSIIALCFSFKSKHDNPNEGPGAKFGYGIMSLVLFIATLITVGILIRPHNGY